MKYITILQKIEIKEGTTKMKHKYEMIITDIEKDKGALIPIRPMDAKKLIKQFNLKWHDNDKCFRELEE